ncbi:(S)-8-oxocitronellyl enol synthase-like [Hibiscus syriacus]|uniref:(S)-8-oxocitronellyl enol synthase-like n=1 Tax=Hibiscus syriacus TaxID=106335 RepID=UPI00192046A7|nr:(S)-8-oxocitronellyl enol synthase-like [Hibiscus syriacus]
MAGLSLAEALKIPKALVSPLKVYGSAMPTWFPSSVLDKYIVFDVTDTGDMADKVALFSGEVTHVLSHITVQTGTQHYMSPIHDLSEMTRGSNPHEPPFMEDLPRFPYPNFYYALEDFVKSYVPTLTYIVHCSSIIICATYPNSVCIDLLI